MPGSDQRAWWRCAAGHEWEATPQARVTRGSGCPYCSGRLIVPERSLPALAPALAAELHPARNDGLEPAALSPGSSRRVWWLGACGHEWQAQVKTRAKVGTGCPYCADTHLRGVPLTAGRPDLVREWHTALNGGPPGELSLGSHKQCWWRCAVDPTHVWRAQVRNRVRAASGCPYCAGKRPTPASCLAAVAPALAAEWHPERNGPRSPTDVLPQSNQPVWWRCARGHEWTARPANRVHGSGCPHCA